ncbi:MAG TPA: MoxR family ATPase [Gemmatimonadales bacterium]|nr:MoxR family ATPase [Gemmatimonadales bacterium]
MERSDVGLSAGDAERHASVAHDLLGRLGGVVLGQDRVLRAALAALIARGHVLLEGVPGTAKTLLVRSLSLALGLTFRRIQFTPDLMPSDVTGVNVLGATGTFTFRPGPLFGDLILADEINRAPAKTQAALLEAMQERSVTVDGVSHALSAAFTVFATQNPIEFEGTYPLPEAELDRFLVKIVLGYPESSTEQAMLQRVLDGFEADDPTSYGIPGSIGARALESLRAARRRIRVESPVLAYITAIVRATRGSPSLTLGASPRGSVALLKLAQATALLDGREYVVPDDVKGIAAAALRHRVTVAPELELEGVTADTALRAVLDQVDAPK